MVFGSDISIEGLATTIFIAIFAIVFLIFIVASLSSNEGFYSKIMDHITKEPYYSLMSQDKVVRFELKDGKLYMHTWITGKFDSTRIYEYNMAYNSYKLYQNGANVGELYPRKYDLTLVLNGESEVYGAHCGPCSHIPNSEEFGCNPARYYCTSHTKIPLVYNRCNTVI